MSNVRSATRLLLAAFAGSNTPKKVTTKKPESLMPLRMKREATVSDDVVTLTLNVVALLALTGIVAGMEQLVPAGAPVQLREASQQKLLLRYEACTKPLSPPGLWQ
jgi:hypothetical protein